MSKLPDFIVIGAMKSATSTLWQQLAQQPGIFMSIPKEPNFFSDDDQFAKGIDWYSRLFASAPSRSLLGEASTHYTKLPTYPQTVTRLREHLPHTRLIYVMRHPVDRLISHYIHEWSVRAYRCSLEEAIEQYPELIAYGQYALQLEPYFEAFGREAVLPIFFDRLIQYAQSELERICRFIGYEGEPLWSEALRPDNVSSERILRFPSYALLIESNFAISLRRALIPKRLREAVKSKLRMQHRPVLSNESRANLEDVFNQDLAHIGDWLGVDLNCRNFKEVTAHKPLNWIEIHDK